MVGPPLDTTKLRLRPPSSATPTIKFLCSYGGKIIPRFPDGKLRYLGGETRVLGVERSISFAELSLKLGELSGTSASLRCQLPKEDLDALVSITSDEDLANLIEEYDQAAGPATPTASLKIRAVLSLPKTISSSPPSSSSSSSSSSYSYGGATVASASPAPRCYHHQISKTAAFSVRKSPPPPHQYQYGYQCS
ncbi:OCTICOSAPEPTIDE/PHOX/BEM1P FAMILY PROTEIN [Salix viminalis]|uniref:OCTICOSAPEPTIDE/PHOX/BEM1P FAMILY PROTEIN n=1 Tax=Salix viminalis TaxID=40686 RepID=A0A9Q0U210_SALVM|nr:OCTICOSAPEPTIDE/PHOX/BEM1P FAMILY PROTEIN [Salix viminalis]